MGFCPGCALRRRCLRFFDPFRDPFDSPERDSMGRWRRMNDFACLLITAGFFALAHAYTRFCGTL